MSQQKIYMPLKLYARLRVDSSFVIGTYTSEHPNLHYKSRRETKFSERVVEILSIVMGNCTLYEYIMLKQSESLSKKEH